MCITEEDVVKRLKTLGYTVNEDDTDIITYILKKTIIECKHFLNRTSIPVDAVPFVIDWVCGNFFIQLFGMGRLTDLDYPISPIQSVRAGDSQVSFATYDGVSGFHKMIDDLINQSKYTLTYWRVLKTW